MVAVACLPPPPSPPREDAYAAMTEACWHRIRVLSIQLNVGEVSVKFTDDSYWWLILKGVRLLAFATPFSNPQMTSNVAHAAARCTLSSWAHAFTLTKPRSVTKGATTASQASIIFNPASKNVWVVKYTFSSLWRDSVGSNMVKYGFGSPISCASPQQRMQQSTLPGRPAGCCDERVVVVYYHHLNAQEHIKLTSDCNPKPRRGKRNKKKTKKKTKQKEEMKKRKTRYIF